jgi:acyl-CoA synthetase (AMP-forming)/AMP-acid ligase II
MLLLEYLVEAGAPAGIFRIEGGHAAAVIHGGPANGADIAFVLRTSGTTDRAKIVPMSHRNIVGQTGKSRRLLGLGPLDRCLNLMPLCYHHGLNSGLMTPLAAGCGTICPPGFDAETFIACMRTLSPTWYTAGFTHQQAILEWLQQRPHAIAGHRLRFARAGSGPLPDRVRVELEKILGAPLLDAYGSTETGLIAAHPLTGTRKPGSVGRSPDDDIGIMNDEGDLLGAGKEGEVVVRGDAVFTGYENDPAANRRVFRGGWYRTGDQGLIDNDGYLKLLGRRDDIINRGGEKISPREVDETLLLHDAVEQAVCFPVPHPTLHRDIAAAVVLRRGAHVTASDLRGFLRPGRLFWPHRQRGGEPRG